MNWTLPKLPSNSELLRAAFEHPDGVFAGIDNGIAWALWLAFQADRGGRDFAYKAEEFASVASYLEGARGALRLVQTDRDARETLRFSHS